MSSKKIICLKGDGVGPELMIQAKKVIEYFNSKSDLKIEMTDCDFGGMAIEKHNTCFPNSTKEMINKVDAILLSSIGDYKYDKCEYTPEMALLDLRKTLDVYINIRPIKPYDKVISLTSFKEDIIKGVDITFYRELSSGAYFGKPRELNSDYAIDTFYYNTNEIDRIIKAAFNYCNITNKKLTSVDKANVLATSKLWRSRVELISKEYPSVKYEHRYVDSVAMDLINKPKQFECIVTENLFGDILTDQASSLIGSLGMLASASLGSSISLFEPGHGSALDIANKNIVNPIAMIKSVALMYLHSFNKHDIFNAIEKAIEKTLDDGIYTVDLDSNNYVNTDIMTNKIIERIEY